MAVARLLTSRAQSVWPVAALAVAVVAGARWGPDWPAQEFRAWLADHAGMLVWTTRWYDGQALPGYSVLYPLLTILVGAGGAGVLAVIATAWGAEVLRPPVGPLTARWYRIGIAITLIESLITGQIPFLLGTAFGVWALWATRASRPAIAVACAVACSLCSPLPGLFLLLVAPAWALTTTWRRSLPLGGAITGIGVSVVFGGASGPLPFPWVSLVGVLVFAVSLVAVAGTRNRSLLMFACCYGLFCLIAFAVPNPVGGNAARLGKLIVLPIAVLVLARETSRRVLPALAALAVVWTGVPVVTGAAAGVADPARQASYYAGLTAFLRTQDPTQGRLEIPFTQAHWEAMWVARSFPLARGWERQTDMQANEVLYDPLTAASYRAWLDDNAVRLIALPDVTMDSGGRAEATLLRRGLPYLHQVWHDANWRVWQVRDAAPLTSAPATMTRLGESSFALRFRIAGTATVRLRASKLWQITRGAGCVGASTDGWLSVTSYRPGAMSISAKVSLDALVPGGRQCTSVSAAAAP